MRKFLSVLAVLVALWLPQTAKAGFEVTLSESGFASQNFFVGSGLSSVTNLNGTITYTFTAGSVAYGNYIVTLSDTDNAPNGGVVNGAFTGNLSTTNISTTAATTPLSDLMVATSDTYSAAKFSGASIALSNALGLSALPANGAQVSGTSTFAGTSTITTAAVSGTFNGSGFVYNPVGAITTAGLSLNSTPNITLSNLLTISGLGTNGEASSTLTTNAVATPTPAPAGLLLLLSGSPALAWWYRRRGKVSAVANLA